MCVRCVCEVCVCEVCVCMHVYVYSVCLRCSESNTWNIFWLTRKDNFLVSELIDGEPTMSKGVVESVGSHNN